MSVGFDQVLLMAQNCLGKNVAAVNVRTAVKLLGRSLIELLGASSASWFSALPGHCHGFPISAADTVSLRTVGIICTD